MAADNETRVIPIIREEIQADARPVHTGSVRVTKHVETHEQILEQELRKGRADVERIAMHAAVDGPLEPRREGRTLIIPVVSEEVIEGCGKRWVQTEEIRVTQVEESETLRQTIPVREEHARVERLDATGHVVSQEAEPLRAADAGQRVPASVAPAPLGQAPHSVQSIVGRRKQEGTSGRVLSKSNSILRKKTRD